VLITPAIKSAVASRASSSAVQDPDLHTVAEREKKASGLSFEPDLHVLIEEEDSKRVQ
jgi:hypothetical protein